MDATPQLIKTVPLLAFAIAVSQSNIAKAAEAEAVVQAGVDAYNAHDIHAFMATYANDAEVYEFPAKRLMRGAVQIEDFYATKRLQSMRCGTVRSR